MYEKLKSFKIKKEYIFVTVLIIAVIILFFSTFYDKDKTENTSNATQDYILNLEKKLKQNIERIDGVKSASVMISVDGGIKTVIAEDVKKTEEGGKVTYTSSPVIVSGEPIVVGETYPTITGVVVVCNCNGNFALTSYVLDLITTTLNIPCDKVKILTQ